MKTQFDEIVDLIINRPANCLVVSGNVYDRIFRGPQVFEDVVEFIKTLTAKKMPQCFTFDIFNGTRLVRGEEKDVIKAMGLEDSGSEDKLVKLLKKSAQSGSKFPLDPRDAFMAFDRLLVNSKVSTLLIIDHADALLPAATATAPNTDPSLGVALANWARSSVIKEMMHLIVLVSRRALDLEPRVLDRAFGVAQIWLAKPAVAEREHFLKQQDVEVKLLKNLAALTAGLTIKELSKIGPVVKKLKEAEAIAAVFELKQKLLREEYGDILEIMEPTKGFECIGGLEKPIAKLRTIAGYIKSGDTSRVPQGIMFMGPPGTGKTVLAEAFAKEAGLNFVKPLDIKNMWVGESERRMSRLISALRDLAPVVVFIDEFDQNQSQRGGFDGDSGVSRNLFKKMLEVMSDVSLRGRILWVMATNRPDLIDAAFKRAGRCDLRIAFLPPDEHQLELICKSAFQQYPDMDADLTNWKPFVKKCVGYTGADMVEVVRRAWERAGQQNRNKINKDDMDWACEDYIPEALEPGVIMMMTLTAILESSSRELLPDNYREVIEVLAKEAANSGFTGPFEKMMSKAQLKGLLNSQRN